MGREGRRERDLEREGKEKPTHPETLKECAGVEAEGGQVRWRARFILPTWGRERGGTAWASEV